MLRKQHKVDEYHNDMPLIYYVEGYSMHFGRPEFALITDVLGVIGDEVMFGNLCDENSVRLCLILALEVIFMGRLLTCPVDDSLFGLVENLEAWNVFPWGEHVLALKRNDKVGRLQFNEDLSRLRGDFVESLNILFQDLVEPHDSVEDIANEYLVDEELKLCLEEEERIRSKQEKRIQQEKRLRLEEEKMLRLEEEKMLQIAEVKKRKRYEFMNSTHVKNILGNFPPIKRNDAHSVTCKAKPKESWVKIKKYRQNVNDPSLAELLKKVKPWVEGCAIDPCRKGWLSEEHIDLWVNYMCQQLHVRCHERREQMLEMQSFLHVSTSLAESYKLLEELQDFELEKCRDLMKSISETQLKVLKKLSFIAKLRRQ
ncbi:hypothetical protein Tco_0735545 [Tanacetum coccineum]